MAQKQFAVGEKVKLVNVSSDLVGTVEGVRPDGGVDVRWKPGPMGLTEYSWGETRRFLTKAREGGGRSPENEAAKKAFGDLYLAYGRALEEKARRAKGVDTLRVETWAFQTAYEAARTALLRSTLSPEERAQKQWVLEMYNSLGGLLAD